MFTDKLVAKIPSTATGIIRKINYSNDTICSVGHPIMTIETEDEAPAPTKVKQHISSTTSSDSASSSSESDEGTLMSEIDKSNDLVSFCWIVNYCIGLYIASCADIDSKAQT